MISMNTDEDRKIYNAILKTVDELDDILGRYGIRYNYYICPVCNYYGRCDENDHCNEGIAEYIYNKIKDNK